MDANALNTQIEIWKYVTADNEGGTPIENFLYLKDRFAYMSVKGGSTTETNLGKLPYTNVEFTIRYEPELDYQCQIKYNEKFYEIEHIEIIGRKAWMKIQTSVYNERT